MTTVSHPPTPPVPLQQGCVYLVGAGPGDPELLTVKAARLIAQADVVVYDHLVSAAVMGLINPAAERIYAGKERGNHALPQDQLNELLLAGSHLEEPLTWAGVEICWWAVERALCANNV